MTALTEQQQHLVNTLVGVNAQIAELKEYADTLKAQLRALPAGEYTRPDGTRAITISPPARRFQPDIASKVLPPELLALVTVPKVDGATAKKVLPPAIYLQCQSAAGDPVVRLA